ncbi:MAG: hypothetical protein ACE5EG_11765, partial [Thermoanaerobaculia bacterium]
MPQRKHAVRDGFVGPALAGAAILVAILVVPDTAAQSRWSLDEEEERHDVILRLLPPASRQQGGKTLIEALVTDPEVHNVVFLLDGEVAVRRRSPPWSATIRLASPPREQLIRAEARDPDDRLLAADEMVVNRQVRPLRVSLRSLEQSAGSLVVRAGVSIPEDVQLERLEAYLNEEPRHSYDAAQLDGGRLENGRFTDGELEITIESTELDPQAFVRLVARLADGRTVEDVALVAAPGFEEEIDVHLVQLQVVVTNRRGLPMRGLQKRHFRISEGSEERQPA